MGASVATTIVATLPTTAERAAAERTKPVDAPRAFLIALVQYGPLTKKRILNLTGYSRGGTSSRAFTLLAQNGWTKEHPGGGLALTETGRGAAGMVPPLLRGPAAFQEACRRVGECAKAFLQNLHSRLAPCSKADVMKETDYARGGTSSRAWTELTKFEYITGSSGAIRIAERLR